MSIIPRPGDPVAFSKRLPANTADKVANIAIQIKILNEDTEPSAKPQKKKKRMIALVNASMAQATQNLKRISSSTIPRSNERQRAERLDSSNWFNC